MSFSINCLEITCSEEKRNQEHYKKIYKNLSERFYLFNDYYVIDNCKLKLNNKRKNLDKFYSKKGNINIQALVGKNGSGKSSLMDLLYMAINNFAFLFVNGKDSNEIEPLNYVLGVCVSIYYTEFDEAQHEGIDFCLECNECKVDLNKLTSDEKNINKESLFSMSLNTSTGKVDGGIEREKLSRLTEKFFYTIVSNYSLQSFISSNYKISSLKHQINKKGAVQLMSSGDSWIDWIFHKNDGYLRSIVLNPYRHKGTINMERELQLSKYRIISLFIYALKNGKLFDEKYRLKTLDDIILKVDVDVFLGKSAILNGNYDSIFGYSKVYPSYDTIEDKINAARDIFASINGFIMGSKTNVIDVIAEYYGWSAPNINKNYIAQMGLIYVFCKLVSISYKNEDYKKYRTIFYPFDPNSSSIPEFTELYDFREGTKDAADELKNFLKNLETKDNSHTATKFKQASFFLRNKSLVNKVNTIFDLDQFCLKEKFTYEGYLQCIDCGDNLFNDLDKIVEHLPPSIFDYSVMLTYNDGKEKKVDYLSLSSGELQLLQTLSTHMYHIRNILSIGEDRPSYRNINMVFDELEICFHPEMQRIFIDKMVFMLESLFKNEKCHFNVFVLTHSPFILSDIPNGRVLYLENGKMNKTQTLKTKSFAGNIGEMFYDSFFMKKTIGAFAEKRIREIVKWEKNQGPEISKEVAEETLSQIGDPVTKSLIEEVGDSDD